MKGKVSLLFNNSGTDFTNLLLKLIYLSHMAAQLRKQRRELAYGYFAQILLFIFFRGVVVLITHQTAYKRLEVLGQERNLIIIFLIHMNHLGFAVPPTVPVIQHHDIMACRRAITNYHANVRVSPLLNHKRTAEIATE
ncbi:hypothetical protein D3C78_1157640 [compost metagenome]